MMNLIALVMAVSAGIVASVPAAHAATLYDSPTWAQMERAIAAAEGRAYVETKAVRRDPTFDQMERLIRAIPGAGGGGCDTNAVDVLANSAVVTNALTVATTNRIAALETATNNLSSSVSGLASSVSDLSSSVSSLESSKADKKTPSASGNLASLTADGNLADSGKKASDFLPATGDEQSQVYNVEANTTFSRIYGDGFLIDAMQHRFWGARFYYDPSGSENPEVPEKELAVKGDIADAISSANPTFSSAVLAVGLNIDTNSVAVLNEIAETFGGFPLGAGETVTTVGGLLAALAAAAAWLKKNKVGSFKSVGGATATVDNGVAELDDFFTESNSFLTRRVNTLIDAKVGDVNAVLAAALDGTEVA